MITALDDTLLNRMEGRRVLIVGDAMLDHYTFGDVSRISPEAPVPVVEVNSEQYLLGGAGNVARNIVALGGQATMVGLIGRDQDGDRLKHLLDEHGIISRLVHDDRRRTTRKTRVIAQNQQIVRIDREDRSPLAASIVGHLLETLTDAAKDHDIIIVSDYGKGLIIKPVMELLQTIKGPSGARPKILVDPKPVNYDLYRGVDILTPNAKEASEGAGIPCAWPKGPGLVAKRLFERLACRELLITLGPLGMALFEGQEKATHIPTTAQKVFDVTGAGDTVIATLALALAAGASLLEASIVANHAAGIVVGHVGAATPTPEELGRSLSQAGLQGVGPLP